MLLLLEVEHYRWFVWIIVEVLNMYSLKGVDIYILFVFANLYLLLKAFQDFLTFYGFRKSLFCHQFAG